MKKYVMMLAGVFFVGFGFWVYDPATAGMWMEGMFQAYPDCMAVRAWTATQSSLPNATPSPGATPANTLIVGPGCYYMLN